MATKTADSDAYTFRCADAGFKQCGWQARSSNEKDLMQQIEQHGRERHNLEQLSTQQREQIRKQIRHAA